LPYTRCSAVVIISNQYRHCTERSTFRVDPSSARATFAMCIR